MFFLYREEYIGKQGWPSGESAGLPPLWSRGPWVRLPDGASHVAWVSCSFSPLLRGFFLRVLRFFLPHQKRTNFDLSCAPWSDVGCVWQHADSLCKEAPSVHPRLDHVELRPRNSASGCKEGDELAKFIMKFAWIIEFLLKIFVLVKTPMTNKIYDREVKLCVTSKPRNVLY